MVSVGWRQRRARDLASRTLTAGRPRGSHGAETARPLLLSVVNVTRAAGRCACLVRFFGGYARARCPPEEQDRLPPE
jgi:hypothetical protein